MYWLVAGHPRHRRIEEEAPNSHFVHHIGAESDLRWAERSTRGRWEVYSWDPKVDLRVSSPGDVAPCACINASDGTPAHHNAVRRPTNGPRAEWCSDEMCHLSRGQPPPMLSHCRVSTWSLHVAPSALEDAPCVYDSHTQRQRGAVIALTSGL